MKKVLTLAILGLSMAIMVNCTPKAGKKIAETPAATKAQTVVQFSEAQLEAGHVLFMNNCAKCHKLKQPETHNAAQWEKILNRMIPKSKLSDEDGKLVRAYVMAHAKQG